MKSFVVIIILAFTSVAYADDSSGGMTGQQRDAKASLYVGSIRSTVQEIKELNKEGATVARKQSEQINTMDLLLKDGTAFEKESDAHNENADKYSSFAENLNPQIDSVNDRCSGTISDRAIWDQCTKDRARIKSLIQKGKNWADEVNTNKVRLDKKEEDLNQAKVKLKENDDYSIRLEGDDYLEKYNTQVKQLKEFSSKLAKLQIGFNACKKAQGTLKKVHEVCGTMFDGNIVQSTEMNYPVPDKVFELYYVPTSCTPRETFCFDID